MSEQHIGLRWRVERCRNNTGALLGGWKAIQDPLIMPSCFDTWAEAMAHADRMAYTATFTLPVAHPQHARKEAN